MFKNRPEITHFWTRQIWLKTMRFSILREGCCRKAAGAPSQLTRLNTVVVSISSLGKSRGSISILTVQPAIGQLGHVNKEGSYLKKKKWTCKQAPDKMKHRGPVRLESAVTPPRAAGITKLTDKPIENLKTIKTPSWRYLVSGAEKFTWERLFNNLL